MSGTTMSERRITLEETRHVAQLARLEFSEPELLHLNADMEAILETIARLERVPVEGLEATLGVGAYANRFREDRVEPSMDREDALRNAPSQRDGSFEIVAILAASSQEQERPTC